MSIRPHLISGGHSVVAQTHGERLEYDVFHSLRAWDLISITRGLSSMTRGLSNLDL